MKRTHRTHLLTVGAAFLTASLLLLAGCGNSNASLEGVASGSDADENSGSTVRLGLMANSPGAFAAAIAEDQGYFEKYGINVKTTTVSAGIDTVNALVLDQLDIGYVADFAAVNRFGAAEQNDLRVFSRLSQSTGKGNKLYVSQDVNSLEDLRGKGFVTHTGTVTEYYVARTLEQAGLSEDDVTLIPVESGQEGYAAMVSGQASASWVSGQDADKLEQEGKFHVITNQEELVIPTLAFSIATKDYLDAHQDDAAAYLKAYNDAVNFIDSSPDEAAEIIKSSLNVPTETSLATFKTVNSKVGFAKEDYDALESLYQWLQDNDRLKFSYTLRDQIDTRALKQALPDQASFE